MFSPHSSLEPFPLFSLDARALALPQTEEPTRLRLPASRWPEVPHPPAKRFCPPAGISPSVPHAVLSPCFHLADFISQATGLLFSSKCHDGQAHPEPNGRPGRRITRTDQAMTLAHPNLLRGPMPFFPCLQQPPGPSSVARRGKKGMITGPVSATPSDANCVGLLIGVHAAEMCRQGRV